jgi:hypothetical protein
MTHILRFVRVFALGTWLGAILFFSFAVAPGVFGILANRDDAGAVVGFALDRLHLFGTIAALVFIVASLALARRLEVLVRPYVLFVLLMFFLTLTSSRIVIPRMDALRERMGSVATTPASDPRRAEFDRLHGISVGLEGSVLLLGLVALFFTVNPKKDQS